MQKKLIGAAIVALPLVIGGFVLANQTKVPQAGEQGYVCPLTGEELPCPKCCPLNDGK